MKIKPSKLANRKFFLTLSLAVLLYLSFLAGIYVTSNPDEFSPPNLFLDDLPFCASYVVKTDGAYFWAVEDTGNILVNSTNDDTVMQSAINQANSNGGGIVFVRAGSYSASVTVKNNTLLMLEMGVTGVTYSTETTGMAVKYSSGHIIFDAPLNMSKQEIKFGVFHTGASFPSSPVEGEFFWRTSDHTLYCYNSTNWVASIGSGTTHDTHQDYDYLIYKDGSNWILKNGTTEQNDASSTSAINPLQWAVNNLTNGGTIHVCSDFDASGANDVLTIRNSKISIKTDLHTGVESGQNSWTPPRITKICLNSTQGSVKQVFISGFYLRNIQFHADSVISHSCFEHLCIIPLASVSPSAILITDENSEEGSEWVDWIYWDKVKILDYIDQTTHEMGAITNAQDGAYCEGTGQWWFFGLDYRAMTNGAVMFDVDDGRWDQAIYFDDLNYATSIGGVTATVFHMDTRKMQTLFVENSEFEVKADTTFFDIDDDDTYNYGAVAVIFSNNHGTGPQSGYTVTFIDCTKNSHWQEAQWYIKGVNNNWNTAYDGGTFTYGTNFNTNQYWLIDCEFHWYKGSNTAEKHTRHEGSATISASTYVDVTHNCFGSPDFIQATPQSDIDGDYWVSNVGSSTFRINVDSSQTVTFYYEYKWLP